MAVNFNYKKQCSKEIIVDTVFLSRYFLSQKTTRDGSHSLLAVCVQKALSSSGEQGAPRPAITRSVCRARRREAGSEAGRVLAPVSLTQ